MTSSTSTALLVIDVQESFRQRTEEWAATAHPAVIENVSLLVDAARERGDTVVWVTHAEPGSGGVFDPDSGFVRVVSELVPADGEPHVTKTSVNAFTTTDLQETLDARGIRRVVVCGIRTEQCCETTARIASDLGYEVVFVPDATTTSDIPAGDGYDAVSGREIVQRTASILASRGFATLSTTAALTA